MGCDVLGSCGKERVVAWLAGQARFRLDQGQSGASDFCCAAAEFQEHAPAGGLRFRVRDGAGNLGEGKSSGSGHEVGAGAATQGYRQDRGS